jgi:hypothetical protein
MRGMFERMGLNALQHSISSHWCHQFKKQFCATVLCVMNMHNDVVHLLLCGMVVRKGSNCMLLLQNCFSKEADDTAVLAHVVRAHAMTLVTVPWQGGCCGRTGLCDVKRKIIVGTHW